MLALLSDPALRDPARSDWCNNEVQEADLLGLTPLLELS